jgi:hypothetical protein
MPCGQGTFACLTGDDAGAPVAEDAEVPGLAVGHWWGVSGQTVTKWRRARGVPATNEGTHRLRSEHFGGDWADEARKKAHAKNGDPGRRAKIAASLRGRRQQSM